MAACSFRRPSIRRCTRLCAARGQRRTGASCDFRANPEAPAPAGRFGERDRGPIFYNFRGGDHRLLYPPAIGCRTCITAERKTVRSCEAFELWTKTIGVQFVETVSLGIVVDGGGVGRGGWRGHRTRGPIWLRRVKSGHGPAHGDSGDNAESLHVSLYSVLLGYPLRPARRGRPGDA